MVACVDVVVDPVLPLQLLDVLEGSLGVGAGNAGVGPLERVQQRFLEATTQAHALVFGQIAKQGRETFFEAHGEIHALDFDCRIGVVDAMSEHELVAVQVSDSVFA